MEFLSKHINNLIKLYFNFEVDVEKLLNDSLHTIQTKDMNATPFEEQLFGEDRVCVYENKSAEHYFKLYDMNPVDLPKWNDITSRKKLSTIVILQTPDDKIVLLKRRTTFAYDKIINCFKCNDVEDTINFCIKCVCTMGYRDRNRLEFKLTNEFYKLDHAYCHNNSLYSKHFKSRAYFLFFWRKLLLELIKIVNEYDKTPIKQMILPGGKLHSNDVTIMDSLKREVVEEIGIHSMQFRDYVGYFKIYDKVFQTIHNNIVLFARIEKTTCISDNFHLNNNEISGYTLMNIRDMKYVDGKGYAINPNVLFKIMAFIKLCET